MYVHSATPPNGLGDFQIDFRAFAIPEVHFEQLFKGRPTKNLLRTASGIMDQAGPGRDRVGKAGRGDRKT